MADEKKSELKVGDVVELVAVERGFRNGRMVEPGRKFQFTVKAVKEGKPVLPKWAQPADKPLPAKKAAVAGDLKPKDAQAAVAGKAGQLAAGAAGGAASGADLV